MDTDKYGMGESLEKSLAANKLSEAERQETLQKLDALG